MDVDLLKSLLNEKRLADVSVSTGVTRQTLNNFLNGGNTTLDTLKALESFFGKVDEEKLFESLSYYGAPLAVTKKAPHYNLHETLKKALKLSKTNSLVASTMPYVFYKQRAALDLTELLKESMKSDTDQLFGYFLEMANEFREHSPFKKFLNNLKKLVPYDRYKKTKLNGEKVSAEFLPLYSRNNLALSWGLLDRGELQDHLNRFEKWLAQSNR